MDNFYVNLMLESSDLHNIDFIISSGLKHKGGSSRKVTFFPYNEMYDVNVEMNMEAKEIKFGDWILLLNVVNQYNTSLIEFPETFYFEVSDYMSKEGLDSFFMPICDAGEYVSPTESINGHIYNINADVTGTQLGATSYNMFLFYILDLDKYIIVTEAYACL